MFFLKTHKIPVKLVLVSLISLAFTAYGQKTVTDDLVDMGKKFNTMSAYDMNVEVRVYKASPDQGITFFSKGRSAKSGDNFYMDILNRKTIVNKNVMLVVDERQKLLMYTRISKAQQDAIHTPQAINIDSIVRIQDTKVRYLVNTDSEKKIEMQPGSGDISTITMSFNPKTYALREIVYTYTEETRKATGNGKVVINYSNFQLSCAELSLFDESKYILVKDNKVIAREAYKKYKLITPGDHEDK